MRTSFSDLPSRMAPYIKMTALDQPVSVAQGPFRLIGTGEGTLEADLSFCWLPTPRFQFEGLYSGTPSLDLQDWTLESEGNLGFKAPAGIVEVSPGPKPARLRGLMTGDWTIGAGPFNVLRFSLVNFPNYIGSPVRDGPEARGWAKSRLETSSDDYNCRVDAIAEVGALRKQLARDPGFLISHVGEWVPSSGSMSASEALKTLKMLHFWFGLLRGAWAGPVFPQGLTDGEIVWRHYAPWNLCENWAVTTWLPECTPIDDDLTDLFSGFVNRWRDSAWQGPLRTAIAWLVAANSPRSSLEVKIILSQVALELLAWVHLVETQQLHSRSDFNKISAAGRIRSLLHHIRVPTEIPDCLHHLRALLDDDTFDGPGVITRIRNTLVHATERNRDKTTPLKGYPFLECSQLALQYLELVILGVCGHSGHYSQRAFKGWKGDDEVIVPWKG